MESKTSRRSFLARLAALPIVGALVPQSLLPAELPKVICHETGRILGLGPRIDPQTMASLAERYRWTPEEIQQLHPAHFDAAYARLCLEHKKASSPSPLTEEQQRECLRHALTKAEQFSSVRFTPPCESIIDQVRSTPEELT